MGRAESFLKRNQRVVGASSRSSSNPTVSVKQQSAHSHGDLHESNGFVHPACASHGASASRRMPELSLHHSPPSHMSPHGRRRNIQNPFPTVPSNKLSIGGVIAVCLLGLGVLAWIAALDESSTVAANQGCALTSRQLDEFVAPRVLAILTEHGSGSGFPLTARDVLTNRHVVEDVGENSTVMVYNENWDGTMKGRVQWISSKGDLAWIKMDEDLPVSPLKIAEEKLQRGDKVYAYGYPKQAFRFGVENLNARGTEGAISAVDMPHEGVLHYEHTAAINNGNSGGPLFNDRGEVVGVNTWMFPDANSAYYAIEIGELRKVFHSLWDMAHGRAVDYYEFAN